MLCQIASLAIFFIKDDKTLDPKRNNFRSLLELIETGDIHALSEDERELIISIRNAFSHNHYGINLNGVADDKDLKLPTIATLIVKKMEELQMKVEKMNSKNK